MKDKLNENLFSVSIITKEGKKEKTNKEFEEILLLCYNNHNKYLINFLTPKARAFYLTNKHTRNCLSNCPLINHINSALDIFIC